MICGMTMYEILWYFMIYSVIGWMIEVSYHAITLGKVVNRGFLNGPLCPVYGSGVLMVLFVLYAINRLFNLNTNIGTAHTFMLFIIGITFATLVEFIAGFLLDKIFHARWWDYSDRRFNLNGYICLEFSIIWGLAIAFVLRIIQPSFEGFVTIIPKFIGIIILIIVYLTFLSDVVITILTVLKLNKELEKMEELQKSISKLSEDMSELIGNSTLKAVDKIEEEHREVEEKKEVLLEAIQDKKYEYESKRAELEGRFDHIRKEIMYRRLFGSVIALVIFFLCRPLNIYILLGLSSKITFHRSSRQTGI